MTDDIGSVEAGAPTDGQETTPAAFDPSQIQDEQLRGWVELKGYKGAEDGFKAAHAAEKHIGVPEARRAVVPDRPDDTEGWNALWDKLGRPAEASEYGLQAPEGQDGAFAEHMSGVLHKAGLTPAQAQMLQAGYTEYAEKAGEQMGLSAAAEADKQVAALKSEWGAAYDQKIDAARRAVAAAGVNADMLDKVEESLGAVAVLKLVDQFASRMGGEKPAAEGDQTGGALTPAAARAKKDEYMADPNFRKNYLAGRPYENEIITDLLRQAANEEKR